MNKTIFPFPLIVKHLDGEMWELMENFEYRGKDTIKVPAGFKFDFASIPRIFWTFIGGPTGRYGPAALCHDYLYFTQTTKRSYADGVFLNAMKSLGVGWIKRRLMWVAVRSAGWIPWKIQKKKLAKELKEST